MGLYDLLVSPTGNPFYAQNSAFINPNSFSTAASFGQRSIPWPSNNTQPYIKIPMPPVSPGEFNSDPINPLGPLPGNLSLLSTIRYNSKTWGPDFLTRGNQYGLIRTADDIERLTKYFFDFANIGKGGDVSGLLFTLKQNLLSLAGDETIYTPFSTITQAAISLSGASVKKQGLFAGIRNGAFSSFNPSYSISEDFRKKIIGTNEELTGKGKTTYLSRSPDYTQFNIEQRTNFRSTGTRGNILNYQLGKRLISDPKKNLGPVDLINALPIYQSDNVTDSPLATDLVDFRIAIIDNNTIGGDSGLKNLYLHFRAYIKGFSDSYDAEWKGIDYMGRGEKFWRYSGFKRDISLSFTLFASSKEELIPMYKKLNFLASSLAPSYSENGYMRGNLAKLTVGDYLTEQPGIIDSLSITVPDDSPWEINLGLDGKPMEDMGQLPHMLEVKMKFTPIHEFRPEIMKLSNIQNGSDFTYDNILDKDPKYGDQGFISIIKKQNEYLEKDQIDLEALEKAEIEELKKAKQFEELLNSNSEFDDIINKYPTITEGITKPKINNINIISENIFSVRKFL